MKTGLVRYPFELRPGVFVSLDLPADLTRADVDRLVRMLATLVMERRAGWDTTDEEEGNEPCDRDYGSVCG